jgi:hypothetical protein
LIALRAISKNGLKSSGALPAEASPRIAQGLLSGMAALVIAASEVIEITGEPLCAAVADAALRLAAVQSERETLRR